MFRTEQAKDFLLFLFQLDDALLESHVLFKVQTSFARKVNSSLCIAERGQLLFSRIELGLNARQLLFKEHQSFLGFGTAHFDILFQICISDSVQNSSNSIRVTVFKRHSDNARTLTFFRNAKTLEEIPSSNLRMHGSEQESLTNGCGQVLDTNG